MLNACLRVLTSERERKTEHRMQFQNFDFRSSGGRAARAEKLCSQHFFAEMDVRSSGEELLERENRAPSTFCKHGSRSSGEVDSRAGSYVDRPSTREAELTPERIFHATSIFTGLNGPLELGS